MVLLFLQDTLLESVWKQLIPVNKSQSLLDQYQLSNSFGADSNGLISGRPAMVEIKGRGRVRPMGVFAFRVSQKFTLNFAERNCEKRRRGKLRGGENRPQNPSPKRAFHRPTCDTFPPPPAVCSSPVISLEERAQTRQIPLSEASKTCDFGGGTLWYIPPPPSKIARYVCPPTFHFPISQNIFWGYFYLAGYFDFCKVIF